MQTDVDPLLACLEKAIALVQAQDPGFERAARACLEALRPEAEKYRDDYLKLSTLMLAEALESPDDERRKDVLDALAACRRTVVAGKP